MDDKIREWAFGKNHKNVPFYYEDEEWNKRHSDIFFLDGNVYILDTYKKIEKAYHEWEKSKKDS